MVDASDRRKKRVIVLGAGVIGLTTALKLQETGDYQVEIIAEILPTDPKTVKYTSQWAGAHYVSFTPTGTEQADIDHKTFVEMWALSEPGGAAEECFLRVPQTEYFATEIAKPNPLERMPGFREVPKNELVPNASYGYSFETVTIDVPVYLKYLTTRLLELGVVFIRGHVQHIDQILEAGTHPFRDETKNDDIVTSTSGSPPDAVIVCAGLGARFLGGVEDKKVYPSRGQTVILRAPWVRDGRSLEKEENWTYIIPRRGGDVVIGGIKGIDEWYPKTRPETTQDLLERGLALCPELIPPETRIKQGHTSVSVDDLLPLVVEEGCGLRPMRNGGPRIEPEYTTAESNVHNRVSIIYNYGHGTQGYIKSIGSAEAVIRLLQEAL